MADLRTVAMVAAWMLVVSAAAAAPPMKLYTEEPGVYRVTWSELVEAGMDADPIPTADLSATRLGRSVPLWIEGSDEVFGPGDAVIFTADRLPGDIGFLDEYSRYTCTVLRADGAAERGRDHAARTIVEPVEPSMVLRHLEHDAIMVRFAEETRESLERWYWSRLSVADREPMRVEIPVPDLDPAGGEVTLRLGLRGWSRARELANMAEHAVEIWAHGQDPTRVEFSGRDLFVAEVRLDGAAVVDGVLPIEVVVPERTRDGGDLLVDVVLLNWIEVGYARSPVFHPGQWHLTPGVATDGSGAMAYVGDEDGVVYSLDGWRMPVPFDVKAVEVPSTPGETLMVVVGDGYRTVDAIAVDTPSALRSSENRADYIMVTHRSLATALEPLAEFHRDRGLEVMVVDIEDVYDEFNHGVYHPRALRDFVVTATEQWQAPAPRFLLLAGDATWDPKNETGDDSRYADWTYRPGEKARFIKNGSTPYAQEAARNLVPTWDYPTYQGHAASDNFFVSVTGDDHLPDLAVGRFAVATADELTAVVEKTIAYARAEEDARDWERRILLITNESGSFQRRSDSIAEDFSARGFEIQKIYPQAEEAANEHHTQAIIDALARGTAMVQFLGHGGRYIWRTGPPDYRKNHDLFTLDHLDKLPTGHPLPVVISLTCYSAPFDHPTADSIGEKLIRLADRGAIAVFAASWRNSPSAQMGNIVMEELQVPGTTIGEAIQRAKHRIRTPILVETYNLLGDPALPMRQSVAEGGALKVTRRMP
jgi:hypothetical protein